MSRPNKPAKSPSNNYAQAAAPKSAPRDQTTSDRSSAKQTGSASNRNGSVENSRGGSSYTFGTVHASKPSSASRPAFFGDIPVNKRNEPNESANGARTGKGAPTAPSQAAASNPSSQPSSSAPTAAPSKPANTTAPVKTSSSTAPALNVFSLFTGGGSTSNTSPTSSTPPSTSASQSNGTPSTSAPASTNLNASSNSSAPTTQQPSQTSTESSGRSGATSTNVNNTNSQSQSQFSSFSTNSRPFLPSNMNNNQSRSPVNAARSPPTRPASGPHQPAVPNGNTQQQPRSNMSGNAAAFQPRPSAYHQSNQQAMHHSQSPGDSSRNYPTSPKQAAAIPPFYPYASSAGPNWAAQQAAYQQYYNQYPYPPMPHQNQGMPPTTSAGPNNARAVSMPYEQPSHTHSLSHAVNAPAWTPSQSTSQPQPHTGAPVIPKQGMSPIQGPPTTAMSSPAPPPNVMAGVPPTHRLNFSNSGIDFKPPPQSKRIEIRKPPAESKDIKSSTDNKSTVDTKNEKAKPDEAEKEATKAISNDEADVKANENEKEQKELAEKSKEGEEDKKKIEAEKADAEKARKEKEEAERKAKEEEEAKAKAAEEAKKAEEARVEEERKKVEEAKLKSEADEKEKAEKEAKLKAEAEQKEKERVKNLEPIKTTSEVADKLPTPITATVNVVDSPMSSHPPSPSIRSAGLPPRPTDPVEADKKQPASNQNASLNSATAIQDLSKVKYPENILSPRADLNAPSSEGKFRYDIKFLMQFMSVCQERPEKLPSLEALGMVEEGSGMGSRGGSSNYNRRTSMGPPSLGRAMGPGGMGNGRSSVMGAFQPPTPVSKMGSGGRPPSLSRTSSASHMLPGGVAMLPQLSSGRGDRRSNRGRQRPPLNTPPAEPAVVLNTVENAWKRSDADNKSDNSPENVNRKVQGLLNKLTPQKFETISEQILEWANKSVDETDGRILRQVIALIFEKATDEEALSESYARLCGKIFSKLNETIVDEALPGVQGGMLLRKYLLTKCQEEFEKGLTQAASTQTVSSSNEGDEEGKKPADQPSKESTTKSNDTATEESNADSASKANDLKRKDAGKDVEMFSDEYYVQAKAKRRTLGLVKFVGHLYRLRMISHHIMKECIKQLLRNVSNPEEEDIESLCSLLRTVGEQIDEDQRMKSHVPIYFNRLKELAENENLSNRTRYMVMDVIDLRAQNWKSKTNAAGPKTISEIHEEAARAKEESQRRVASSGGRGLPKLHEQLSRTSSRRGQARDALASPGPDGWTNVTAPRPPNKAGDLSSFGKLRAQTPSGSPALTPSGYFSSKRGTSMASKEPPKSQDVRANSFAVLEAEGGSAAAPAEKDAVRPQEAAPQPRVKTEKEIATSIDNGIKEFFASTNDTSEAVASFTLVPESSKERYLKQLCSQVLERNKNETTEGLAKVLASLLKEKYFSKDVMLGVFKPTVLELNDLSMDFPLVYKMMGQWLSAVQATKEDLEPWTKESNADFDLTKLQEFITSS